VRGAIPTPGPRRSATAAFRLRRLADDTCIVLDAGTGIRELGKALAPMYARDATIGGRVHSRLVTSASPAPRHARRARAQGAPRRSEWRNYAHARPCAG